MIIKASGLCGLSDEPKVPMSPLVRDIIQQYTFLRSDGIYDPLHHDGQFHL